MPLVEEEEEDEHDGNQYVDLDEQTVVSLTVGDVVRPRGSFRRRSSSSQRALAARNASTASASVAAAAAALSDSGTIWSILDPDATGLSNSNESSLNYSEVSDITLFSTATGAVAGIPIHQSQIENKEGDSEHDGGEGRAGHLQECNEGDQEATNALDANNETDSQRPIHASLRIESENSPSRDVSIAESGPTSVAETNVNPTRSLPNDSAALQDANALPPVTPPQLNPSEEGGFLAFLAQMRQLTEQPVDSALREFVPTDVAESARAAPAEYNGDDAETVVVGNEGNDSSGDRQLHPEHCSSASKEESLRGGSMLWMFSIPTSATHSTHPLLGDRDKTKAPDFREIPLSYSPSATMQPWGPNASDLWTSTTRLLAAIPEEVASVMSTASMSLSFTKKRVSGSVDEDPTSTSKMKVYLAIAILVTLIIVAACLVFVVMAILSSEKSTLKTTAMPMPPIMPPVPSVSLLLSSAPSVAPSLRSTSVPSTRPFSLPSTPADTPPSTLDIGPSATSEPAPSSSGLSIEPSTQAPGQGYGSFTEIPSSSPFSNSPLIATPEDEGDISGSPSPIAESNEEPGDRPTISPSLYISGTDTQAPVINDLPPWYSELADKIQPSSAPSSVSQAPTIEPSSAPSPSPTAVPSLRPSGTSSPPSRYQPDLPLLSAEPSLRPSFYIPSTDTQAPVIKDLPPSYWDILDMIQPSSKPSSASQAPTIEPGIAPSTAASSPSPTPVASLRPSGTSNPPSRYQPDILVTETPTESGGQNPSNSPSEERMPTSQVDSTTATPTQVVDNGILWERDGEITGSVGYRSVKLSEAGNRVAVATSSQVHVFARTEDGTWQAFGNAIDAPGIQAVAISGDGNTLAHWTFFGGDDSGSVYIDRWDGQSWLRIGGELPGSCPYHGCMKLSSDGSIVAIGNPLNDAYTGLVTVLTYDDASQEWRSLGEPITGEMPGDMAGTSVSLSSDGSVIAVGAPGRTVDGQISIGQAIIFKYDPSLGWSKVGQSLLGFDQLKQFGFSISLSGNGNRVAISAPFVDYLGDLRGAVYVYDLSLLDGMWKPLGSVIRGAYLADNAGTSIALSLDGQTLAVGAPRRSYVQIFTLHLEEGWTPIGFIESDDDEFGSSVAISSDGRTVGASGTSALGNGMVQIFRRGGDLANRSAQRCNVHGFGAMSADC